MITGGFYPALPVFFPARIQRVCYKLDMDSKSWITSSPLFQTEDQGNSEYAHKALGAEQDIFTLLVTPRIPALPCPWAVVVTKSEL